MEEEIYYQNDNRSVFVSNARIILGGRTFVTSSVSSVGVNEKRPRGYMSKPLIAFCFCIGILASAIGVFGLFQSSFFAGVGSIFLLFGLGFIMISVAGIKNQNKKLYVLSIGASSGEIEALVSSDKNIIMVVSDSINKAIIGKQISS